MLLAVDIIIDLIHYPWWSKIDFSFLSLKSYISLWCVGLKCYYILRRPNQQWHLNRIFCLSFLTNQTLVTPTISYWILFFLRISFSICLLFIFVCVHYTKFLEKVKWNFQFLWKFSIFAPLFFWIHCVFSLVFSLFVCLLNITEW